MKYITAILLFLASFLTVFSQPKIKFQPIISGLSEPVDIVSANDNSNRLFIVEQSGKVKIWNGNILLPAPFLDISNSIVFSSERGLLSLAFHPDFSNNGFFYVYYNDSGGNITIARYKVNKPGSNEADISSGVVLLRIPKLFENHNGGKLNFGKDGYLYFGTGDGGGFGDPFGNAQNNKSYFGKMLRINVTTGNQPPYYSIPDSNPFKNNPNYLGEIIATGLRNPWRWSFDKLNGDMWIADVGQDLWEEVNRVSKDSILNVNYGWNCYEASEKYNPNCTLSNSNIPVFAYTHDFIRGGYSITGGYVYRGIEFPALQGYYICADFVTGNGWLINPRISGGWGIKPVTNFPTGISTFGESETGTLYAATLKGVVYQVTASSDTPVVRLKNFSAINKGQIHELNWEVENQNIGDTYIIEGSIDNKNTFSKVGSVVSDMSATLKKNTFQTKITSNADYYYRLKVFSSYGSNFQSEVVFIPSNTKDGIKAWLSENKVIQIFATENIKHITITDISGRILLHKNIADPKTADFIPLFSLSKGIVICKVATISGTTSLFKFIN